MTITTLTWRKKMEKIINEAKRIWKLAMDNKKIAIGVVVAVIINLLLPVIVSQFATEKQKSPNMNVEIFVFG